MSLSEAAKRALDRNALRPVLEWTVNRLAKWKGNNLTRISYEDGIWLHRTSDGWFAYNEPYVCLDLRKLDDYARFLFFWGYRASEGHTIIDVGAGVGEEALTFSRAVGASGKVVCLEAHPRTYLCLHKLVEYNHLDNVVAIHAAVAGPGCGAVNIEDSRRYLRNRMGAASGFSVPATTVDTIRQQLNLERIQFLKMNIEGAERLAIQGMSKTLQRTEVVCICCHDFLAENRGDSRLKTRAEVQQFLQDHGLSVLERNGDCLPPYVRYQLWGYNEQAMRAAG